MSTTGMETALRDPAILGEIFEYYNLQVQAQGSNAHSMGTTDYKTCLAAALTCKSFLSPALDILWRELDDIEPLIAILPGICYLDDDTMCLRASVSHSDLKKMTGYAKRVRYLHLSSDFESRLLAGIESELLAEFQTFFDNSKKPFLPCLRLLHITTHQNREGINIGSPYIPLLLSPTLQRIIIERDTSYPYPEIWPHQAPFVTTLFQALLRTPPPYLHTIETCISLPYDTIAKMSEKVISLERLWLNGKGPISLTLQDLQPLTTLGRLKVLFLEFHDVDKAATIPTLEDCAVAVFPTLEELLILSDVLSLHRFLSFFQLPKLKDLMIQFSGDDDDVELWEQLFTTIAQAAPNLCRIRTFRYGSKMDTKKPVSLSLPPLLSLKPLHLTQLFLHNPILKPLENEGLLQLASALPHLQSLNIITRERGVIELASLDVIASHFPQLRYLAASFRLQEALPVLTHGAGNAPQMQLKKLRMYLDLKIEGSFFELGSRELYAMAQFIDALFPNLKVVEHVAEEHIFMIEALNNFIRRIQCARLEERELLCLYYN